MKQIILILLVLLPVCAFAQFNETFDGPEIDSKNPWKGDLDKFVISNGQLTFDGSGLSETNSLHLPINYSSTMEWEMDVSLAFKPSNVNKACIYLYRTDKPSDLIFYIQVGGNNDNVSLYKYPPTGSPKSLIVGKRRLEGQVVHIKLTLENNKLWTLYTRLGNEKGYQKEGERKDEELKDVLDAASFNISCICKAKTKKDMLFFFDNIIVRHELTETLITPDGESDDDTEETIYPELVNITQEDNVSLLLSFNKAIIANQYSISLSELGDCKDVYISEDNKTLKVIWEQPFQKEKSYKLSYSGIFDESGNECMGSKSFTSTFGTDDNSPEPAPLSSILINEIMADPKGLEDLPQTEYVELYNQTDNNLTLSDWQFSYAGKAKPMTTFELPANGYAVLYRSGRDIDVDPSAVQVPLDNFPSSLANAGKQIMLLDASGTIIDEYTYPKAKPAQSWERSSSGSWHLCSDPRGGTPGSVNSSGEKEDDKDPEKPDDPNKPDNPVIPDDPDKPTEPTIPVEPLEFVINELLPNPFADGSEYIELYNRSDHALPLSGLVVATRKSDGTLSTRYPLSSVGTMIEPGGYAVLTKSKAGVADFYTIQSPASLFEIAKLPILANTSSTLVLFRASDGTVIDEVAYSSKWHASSVKNQKGVALERIDPEAETQMPANWTSAAASAGYGTPGYRNSQSDNPSPDEPDTPTGIEAPEWLPGSDNYKISYYLDQPGYNCRAFVYNTTGQRVAQIANHELLGLSGQLTWNGSSLSGNRLRTGVYIFYAELYHINGTVKRYKQVFLVR